MGGGLSSVLTIFEEKLEENETAALSIIQTPDGPWRTCHLRFNYTPPLLVRAELQLQNVEAQAVARTDDKSGTRLPPRDSNEQNALAT